MNEEILCHEDGDMSPIAIALAVAFALTCLVLGHIFYILTQFINLFLPKP